MRERIVRLLKALSYVVPVDPVVRAISIEAFIAEEMERIRARTPESPLLDGFKVFSQVDEDGIIQSIIDRLPHSAQNEKFIEIGCGRGVENNTAFLALKGYRGVWVDGDAANIQFIHDQVPETRDGTTIRAEKQWIYTHNIAGLVSRYAEFLGTTEPVFFSLDIDGNDAYVLGPALEVIRPAVMCVEYNGKFPASLDISIAHNDGHTWQSDDYHGASLAAFVRVLSGYRLVCCSIAGTNAFFVRADLAGMFADYTPAQLHQPARYELVKRSNGHSPTLKWLRDVLDRSAS